MTLTEIIARVQVAAGPDRAIDKAIRVALGYPPKPWDYTSSLDAALSLVPEGYDWIVANVNGHHGGTPYACVGSDQSHHAATPVLSLVLAALRARAAV